MISQNNFAISRVGLGCGRMTNAYNDEQKRENIATIRGALDAGVNFFNTANFYGSGQSEMIVGEGLKGYDRDKLFISLKFGGLIAPDGAMYGLDVRPLTVKNYLTHSLKLLNVDYIDLYQPARIDLAIPVEETIGAIADMVKAGYVKHIGLSQVDAETLRKAHLAYPISMVEMEYSIFNRTIEKDLLPTARELGIKTVAYGAIARGLLSGTWTPERIQSIANSNSYQSRFELFSKENLANNLKLVSALQVIADEKQIMLTELAFAWLLAKGDDIIPLIGASKLTHFQQSITALNVKLSANDIKRIEDAVPQNAVAGNFANKQFKNGKEV